MLIRMKLPALFAAATMSLCTLGCTLSHAQTSLESREHPTGYSSIELLWPAGSAPLSTGTTNEDAPRLYSFPAAGPGLHPAVLLLPGGGYTHLVMDKESGIEAVWLNQHGISAYVLQYRVNPKYLYPAPLLDGLRAMRYVRAHATAWHLQPDAIGVWGFSAGGHMAGYLSTVSPANDPTKPTDATDALSARPDFAILSYARVDLAPAIPGTFGMLTLTGPNASKAMLDAVDPILHVTKGTPPTFIYSTEHDEKVDPLNATLYFNALHLAGVPAELHVFELGQHGTHMGTDQPNSPELAIFPTLLEHWLELHHWIGNPGTDSTK
jgi:acetyl esterase/lipase